MKNLTYFVILLLPALVFAENRPVYSQKQMQGMMKKALEMQTCMQNIDQSEMRAFEEKGKQMETEVKKLCAAGKPDEAQSKAISFGKEAAKSSALQEMEKCGEMMQGMVPNLSGIAQDYENFGDERHICDSYI